MKQIKSFSLQKILRKQFELPLNQRKTGTSEYSLNQTMISFAVIEWIKLLCFDELIFPMHGKEIYFLHQSEAVRGTFPYSVRFGWGFSKAQQQASAVDFVTHRHLMRMFLGDLTFLCAGQWEKWGIQNTRCLVLLFFSRKSQSSGRSPVL